MAINPKHVYVYYVILCVCFGYLWGWFHICWFKCYSNWWSYSSNDGWERSWRIHISWDMSRDVCLIQGEKVPRKNWTFLLSCPATDFAAGTNRHNHPMLTGLSEVEKHVSTVVESRWGWWKHDPSWSIRTLVPRVSSEIPRSWTLCPLCWFISLIFHCWVYGVYA